MTHINIILTYLFPFVIAAGYFSVCLSNTRSGKPLKSGISLKAALLFGASASAMLLAGYYAAGLLENRVEDAEKWVVMVMLLLIGYRMIMHGWRKRASVKVFDINLTSVILAMSFALGINGLFAGVALNFLDIPFQRVAWLTGATVFFFSFSGLLYGRQFGSKTGYILEIIAGLGFIVAAFTWYAQQVL